MTYLQMIEGVRELNPEEVELAHHCGRLERSLAQALRIIEGAGIDLDDRAPFLLSAGALLAEGMGSHDDDVGK